MKNGAAWENIPPPATFVANRSLALVGISTHQPTFARLNSMVRVGFLWLVACSAAFAQECPYFILNRVPIGQFNQPVVESSLKVNSKKGIRKNKYAKMTRVMDTSYHNYVTKSCIIDEDSVFIYPAGQLIFCLPSRFSNIDSKYQPSHLASRETFLLRSVGGPKIDSILMIKTGKVFYHVQEYLSNCYLLSSVVFYDPSREEGKGVVEDYTSIFATYIDYRIPGDSIQDGIKLKKFQGDFMRFVRKYPQSAYAPSLLQFLDVTLVMSVRGKNKDFLFEVFRYLLNQRSIFGERFVRHLSGFIHYAQQQWRLSDEEVESLFAGRPNPYDYYFKNPVRAALAKLQKK